MEVPKTNLEEQVCHDAVVHHGALHPLRHAVSVGVQQAALVMPAGEIISEQRAEWIQ